MTETPDAPQMIAGVDRTIGSSAPSKGVFVLLHGVSVGLCAYLVFGDGVSTVGGWFGASWSVQDPGRATLMLAVVALYFVRHIFTLATVIQRRVAWSEALGLGLTMLVVEPGFCFLAAGVLAAEPSAVGPWAHSMIHSASSSLFASTLLTSLTICSPCYLSQIHPVLH